MEGKKIKSEKKKWVSPSMSEEFIEETTGGFQPAPSENHWIAMS